MKCLVVYYSLEGNTKLIAERIITTLGADVLELKPVQEIGKSGLLRLFKGGREALQKARPELKPYQLNLEEYELVFVGSPVWAGRCAPAINTFLDQCSLAGKKVALFCCYGGSAGKLYEQLKEALPHSEILGTAGFKNPLKKKTDESVEKAREWAKEMLSIAKYGKKDA